MKKTCIITLLTSICFSIFAQTLPEENVHYEWGIATVPQYAIASTVRIDFDKTLRNNNVLTIAPMFSYAQNSSLLFNSNSDSYSAYYDSEYPEDVTLIGGGGKLNFRHFFGRFHRNTGLYLGAGLHYRFSHIEYSERAWAQETVDDADYYHYKMVDKEQNFNQVGFDCMIGYQVHLLDKIFLDVFTGWGLRISDHDAESGETDYWGETIYDIAYSGYTPLWGLRLGVFL